MGKCLLEQFTRISCTKGCRGQREAKMKKLLAALCLLLTVASAHAQTGSVKTQTQLNTEIGTTGCSLSTCLYPDTPPAAITAFGLRQGLLDLTATMFSGADLPSYLGSGPYTIGKKLNNTAPANALLVLNANAAALPVPTGIGPADKIASRHRRHRQHDRCSNHR